MYRLVALLTFGLLLVMSDVASAQGRRGPRPQSPPDVSGQCKGGFCGDNTAPIVTLLSGTTATSQYPTITIEWCDNVGLNEDSRQIQMNSSSVTSSFDYSVSNNTDCVGERALSTTTSVALSSGQNTLYAYICDYSANCTGETFYITWVSQAAPTIALRNQNGSNIDRGLCLTFGAGEAAGLSCGDLFVAHGMPAYRTMGVDRSLTLMYNVATAIPRAVVATSVTQPSDNQTPDYVFGKVTVGSLVDSARWYGTGSGTTSQIVMNLDVSSLATGVYAMTSEVQNRYTGVANYGTSTSGEVIVVNRTASEFGRGWWLAGVEQLVIGTTQLGTRILWVGGDGSAAIYNQVNSSLWRRASGPVRDSLTLSGSEYTRHLRHGAKVVFNLSGRHVRTVNRAGLPTYFTWTTTSPYRLTSIQVPPNVGGTTYSLVYSSNYLDYISDPGGRILNATVTSGNLATLVDPDTVSVQFTYDASGRIIGRTGRNGHTTKYTYANGLHVTRTAIPTNPSETDAARDTSRTLFQWWDEQGLAHSGYSYGTYTALSSDLAVTKVFGPRVSVDDNATFWVDRWGAPTKIVGAVADTTLIQRGSSTGLVTMMSNPVHDSVTMTYDTLRGNLLSMIHHTVEAGGSSLNTATTRWTYNVSGVPDSPDSVIDPVGLVTRYAYNSLGFLRTAYAPGGDSSSLTYPASGLYQALATSTTDFNVLVVDTTDWTKDPANLTSSISYDSLGNEIRVLSPTGDSTKYYRDSYTRLVRVDDPAGHRTDYRYDIMNRPLQVRRFEGGTADSTQYRYTTGGQVDTVVDPRGVIRSWAYNAAGHAVEMKGDTGQTERRYFGPSGLLDSIRHREPDTTRFRYDAAGRLLVTRFTQHANTFGSTYSALNSTISADSIVREYDRAGRMTRAYRSNSEIVRTYNREGTVRTERQLYRSGSTVLDSFTTQTWTDLAGRRTQFNDGRSTLTYGYGATGRLRWMAVGWTGTSMARDSFSFYWDALGRRDSLVYHAPGVYVGWLYDANGNMRAMCSRQPTNNVDYNYFIQRLRYRNVDIDGQVRSMDHYRGGSVGGSSCGLPMHSVAIDTFAYDSRHQLVSNSQRIYTYDASGNRLSRRLKSNPATLDDSLTYLGLTNRLFLRLTPSGTLRTYRYNKNGDMHYEEPGYSLHNARFYYYNGLGEQRGLRAFNASTGLWEGSPSNCDYDADGRRFRGCGDGFYQGFDGDNVIRGGSSVSFTVWRFVQGPATDDPLVGLYQISSGTYEKYYYLTDGRGRQLAFVNSSGVDQLGGYAYSNGGNQAGSISNSQGFENGRAESPNAPQLSFYRNRYYDQTTGRWTQEDPIGVAGGVNLYGYVGNNPAAYTDPFGLCPDPIACFAVIRGAYAVAQRLRGVTMGDVLHVASHPLRAGEIAGLARATARLTNEWANQRGFGSDANDPRRNTFRHLAGACQLTQWLGANEARAMTNAHETALSGDSNPEDTAADLENNATGIRMASDSRNTGKSCGEMADQAMASGVSR